MFKNDLIITLLNTKNSFLEVSGKDFAFDKGKITFFFGEYDTARPEGSRLTKYTKIWLPIEEASLLSNYLSTNRIITCSKQVEQKLRYKPFIHAGGRESSTGIIARQLYVDVNKNANSKYLLSITGVQGPGRKTEQGLFAMTSDKSKRIEISIPLTYDDSIKLGISLERAIRYFDLWSALGVLDNEVKKRTPAD